MDGGNDSSSGSNPGQITCGGSTCNTSDQECCIANGDAGCQIGACQGGLRMSCDEPADCIGALRCCLGFAPEGGAPRAQCETGCGARPQLCKTNADCPGTAQCRPYTCPRLRIVVHTCSPPPYCND
jgi:hypothetical protein